MAIFFTFPPISNHLHPLQVENCGSNSRLVVDEDDNYTFRLERVNNYFNIDDVFCSLLVEGKYSILAKLSKTLNNIYGFRHQGGQTNHALRRHCMLHVITSLQSSFGREGVWICSNWTIYLYLSRVGLVSDTICEPSAQKSVASLIFYKTILCNIVKENNWAVRGSNCQWLWLFYSNQC